MTRLGRELAACAALSMVMAGCAKVTQAAAHKDVSAPVIQADAVPDRHEVIGPVHWWHASGLCLDVPEGWIGVGQDGEQRLLHLKHPESGVQFSVISGVAAVDRLGFSRVFIDSSQYRDLPALQITSVESWVSEAPAGESLQVWSGSVGDRLVSLEMRYPFGQVIVGANLTEQIFRAICTE